MSLAREPTTRALRPSVAVSRSLTDRWRGVAYGGAGVAICFLWAVGEATVWPIIPDVALFLLALAAPRRAPRLLLATAAGAAVGGVATVLTAWLAPPLALAVVMRVPLVHSTSVPIVVAHLQRDALLHAFLYQPWSGIPFKLWAVLGVTGGHPPLAIIPCFIIGRSLRFLSVAATAAAVGRLLELHLRDIAIPLLAVFGPSGAYLFYRVAIAG